MAAGWPVTPWPVWVGDFAGRRRRGFPSVACGGNDFKEKGHAVSKVDAGWLVI